jgi:hypothetical protein
MWPRIDRTAIATRIRALVTGSNGGDLQTTARRLDVAPVALSRSIDPRFPRLSLTVITAIVREYGVDPWWLMYGNYDHETHALASEIGSGITTADVLRLVESPRERRIHEPLDDRPSTQLDA